MVNKHKKGQPEEAHSMAPTFHDDDDYNANYPALKTSPIHEWRGNEEATVQKENYNSLALGISFSKASGNAGSLAELRHELNIVSANQDSLEARYYFSGCETCLRVAYGTPVSESPMVLRYHLRLHLG
jgi:hypothetical protein